MPIRARSCRKSRAHGFSRPRYELSPIISLGIFHKHCETLDTTKETLQNNQKSQSIIATTVFVNIEVINVPPDCRSNWQQFLCFRQFALCAAFRCFPDGVLEPVSSNFLIKKLTELRGHLFSGNSRTMHIAPHPFSCRRFIAFFEAGETFSDKKRN